MVALLVVLTGCGNKNEFVIKCEIAGLGEHGVEMYYVTEQGVRRSDFHPDGERLTLRGSSKKPAFVEVFMAGGGERLFGCVVMDGDKIEVKLDPEKPESLSIKGNRASEEYAEFLSAHASLIGKGPSRELNDTIRARIEREPRKLSSALLLMSLFNGRGNESLADTLLQLVADNEEAHPLIDNYSYLLGLQKSNEEERKMRRIELPTGRDSAAVFVVSNQSYGLLAFSSVSARHDSLSRTLKRLYKKLPRKSFRAMEIYLDGDSAAWGAALEGDSALWVQAWAPGGVAHEKISPLKVAQLPYYIVLDSAGRELYRGASFRTASDSIQQKMKGYLTD